MLGGVSRLINSRCREPSAVAVSTVLLRTTAGTAIGATPSAIAPAPPPLCIRPMPPSPPGPPTAAIRCTKRPCAGETAWATPAADCPQGCCQRPPRHPRRCCRQLAAVARERATPSASWIPVPASSPSAASPRPTCLAPAKHLGRQQVLAHQGVPERLAVAPHHPVDQVDEMEAHVRIGVVLGGQLLLLRPQPAQRLAHGCGPSSRADGGARAVRSGVHVHAEAYAPLGLVHLEQLPLCCPDRCAIKHQLRVRNGGRPHL